MASAQCCKPVDKSCSDQDQQSHSLGQKMSEMAGWVFKKEETQQPHGHTMAAEGHTQRYTHTQAYYTDDVAMEKTQTYCSGRTHNGHGMTGAHSHSAGQTKAHGKTRRSGEHKKGLLQKIKDGISGHSDSGSSSSSESDSDDEKSGRRKK